MEKGKDKNPQNLEAELLKCTTLCEYERAIKIANKILQKNPNDVATFECKAICLLQTNQFEEALRLTNNNPKLSQGLNFERAYCYYRLNKTEEALKAVEEISQNTHGVKELKAQILYRLDKHLEALNQYNKIFREDSDDEYEEERQTNLCAVASFLKDSNEYENHLKEDTYEMCFNKACMFARRENYSDAESLLKKSEKLLKETFEEDAANDEDIESEMAHIRALQAYCYQKQGRVKEAHQIYLSVVKLDVDDATLNAVISNNIVVINKEQNVFDSKKKMKVATNETSLQKLPAEQRKTIILNNAIFNFNTHQYEQARKMCINIEKDWPEHQMQAKILGVLSQNKINAKTDPVDELLKYEAKSEKENLYVKLTSVQLLLNEGKTARACEILESLESSYRYKPAIVGALITLYLSMGKEDVALKIYEESIEWYKSNEKSGMDLTNFFAQAAEFHIRSGRPEVAAKSLEQLLARNPKDTKTLAQLIIAYSQFDNKKVIELGKKLGSTKEIKKDVDVENLENAIWLAKKAGVIATKDSSPGVHVEAKKKKKSRKRPGKKPKNYDASAAPDPERWLPKYERTGFRKKRDRRMKDIIKGSQGTSSGQSEQYDYSKLVVDSEDTPGSVDPSPMQKNNPNKRNVQNKKKKNKRR